ncbi:MAG TPA: Na+/H+ antiporter subunit E [Acidimicrobiales bacterium]|nr:Na+/H+ antiporter subunit E [Acidimicrobiales bacterium]
MTAPRFALTVAALTGCWLLLQGEITAGNILAGAITSGAVLLVFPVTARSTGHRVHPIALARLAASFARQLVLSNVAMVRAVARPTDDRLRAGIVHVYLAPTSPLVLTVTSTLISLTPGTLTITAGNEDGIHAHFLGLTTPHEARNQVQRLHEQVVAAIEPTSAPENAL